MIIEDDYDGEFQYERPETGCLPALAPDRVVLVGSVSKSLAPALRLGWAVAPPPLAEAVAVERAITDFGTPTLDQLALSHLLSTGGYARHLRHAARHYRDRLRRLLDAVERHIPHAHLRGSATVGLHLCLELRHTDESTLLRTAAARGVALQSTHAMHLRSPDPGTGTLLALGVGQLPQSRVDEAVAALATALRSSGASARHTEGQEHISIRTVGQFAQGRSAPLPPGLWNQGS
ncbi:hypothetical protein [Streptomyces sp. NPDC058665]|uniref:hypothetical protein n=1 Tax=Streptomyces sp. NPDC058665 TaxID=3346586 RepID=UPI00364C7D62